MGAISQGGLGGGATVTMDTFANTPSGPAIGDTHICTDVPYTRRWNGTAWTQVITGVGVEAILPVLGDYTWVNQGASTAVDTRGSIDMAIPIVGGLNLRVLKKAAPATPWTIEAWIRGTGVSQNFLTHGLVYRESGTGRLVSNAQRLNQVNSIKYNSPTSSNTTYITVGTNSAMLGYRISDDGTTSRVTYISGDGVLWIPIHTVGRTDWLTADEVGFYADNESGNLTAGLRLLSWREF